ncbi:MAG: thioredoxin domain-containing protein [Candidatus Aenigmatarchaeota archaeon]
MAEEIKPQEVKQGKTIVIGKKKFYIAIVAAVIILSVGAFLYFSPSGKVEYVVSDSPVLGSADAAINVVEFSDYECPFCQAAEGTNQQVIASLKQSDPAWQAPVPNLIEAYVNTGKVKLIFRQYPVHRDSSNKPIINPSLASKCAQEQGKFWEYHKNLFEKYTALSDIDLKRYAIDMGLNTTQFNDCMESKKYEPSIQKDLSDGQALGVSGTPTFFIGNDEIGYQKVVGAQSFSAFKRLIDSMLIL